MKLSLLLLVVSFINLTCTNATKINTNKSPVKYLAKNNSNNNDKDTTKNIRMFKNIKHARDGKPTDSNLRNKNVQETNIIDVTANAMIQSTATSTPLSSSTKNSNDNILPFWYSIFPIYPKELKKFFSLSFMMFWIVFVFTMTRDTKDALIVTNCKYLKI